MARGLFTSSKISGRRHATPADGSETGRGQATEARMARRLASLLVASPSASFQLREVRLGDSNPRLHLRRGGAAIPTFPPFARRRIRRLHVGDGWKACIRSSSCIFCKHSFSIKNLQTLTGSIRRMTPEDKPPRGRAHFLHTLLGTWRWRSPEGKGSIYSPRSNVNM